MKRSERVSAMVKILSDAPSRLFSLGDFCRLFHAAKSSISEDLREARKILETMDLGRIETVPGAGGGVRYLPYISDGACLALQNTFCGLLNDPGRILAGSYLYTSDLMFQASLMKQIAVVFARKFQPCDPDFVVTVETKGIAVAAMTAHLLNKPLVVVRRESRISEGSTVSINYFSGSSDRVQKMSVARRAVPPGSKGLIIDDFMRAGGSVKGISDILNEFDAEVAGTGIVIAATRPERKKINDYCAFVYLGEVDEDSRRIEIFPNIQIF